MSHDTPDTDGMPDQHNYWTCGSHGERVLPRKEWRLKESVARLEREHPLPVLPESAVAIARECDRIKAMLIEKNLKYGNSALDPVRIFSAASTTEQLLVRIDDKLSRLRRGGEYPGDDTTLDLIGYLILLRVALNKEEV